VVIPEERVRERNMPMQVIQLMIPASLPNL